MYSGSSPTKESVIDESAGRISSVDGLRNSYFTNAGSFVPVPTPILLEANIVNVGGFNGDNFTTVISSSVNASENVKSPVTAPLVDCDKTNAVPDILLTVVSAGIFVPVTVIPTCIIGSD